MSLFSSLYTGATGLNAQSKSTAMISTNIANINTTGYKKSESAFYDLVTTAGASRVPYSSGGVTATRVQRIGLQGQVQQTNSSLDAAIVGNGFYVVKDSPDPAMDFYYTRNGLFDEFTIRDLPIDPDGDPLTSDGTGTTYLRNAAGFYLYGWQLDQDGNLPPVTDFTTLVPVDTGIYDNAFLSTTRMDLRFNLDGDQAAIDPHALGQQLPVSNQAPHFVRSTTIIDGAGTPRQVTMEFRRITGPMAHFTTGTNLPLANLDAFIPTAGGGPTTGIAVGDQFDIALSTGATETYTFVDEATGDNLALNQIATVSGLISAIDDHGGGGQLRATLTAEGRLLVRAIDPTATATLTEVTGTPLTGGNTLNIADIPGGLVFAPEASLTANGAANPDQTDFPAFANTANPNVHNWWEVRVMIPDPAQAGNPAAPLVEIRKGLINFNGDGSLNALPDVNGDTLIDMSAPIDFDTAAVGEESGFVADIGAFTQYGNGSVVISQQQNGIPAGERIGVEITADGRVAAVFANGMKRGMYQIPLAVFRSPDSLRDMTGTIFAETENSGAASLEVSGDNGAGFITPSSLESSNADLADEFGKLIVSQRAFGASSQVIRTVDEMTQRLAELSR